MTTQKNWKKNYRGVMGVILGVGQNWPSKTKIPIFGNFSKNVTYIKKECILGVHFKFQRNRTIIAPVRAFQRKSINHFGTAAVTLNTVRNDLWWSQMKGVGPRNSFTWKFVKFCYLGSKNQGWSDLTPPVQKWGMNSPCNKGLIFESLRGKPALFHWPVPFTNQY